MSNPRKEYLARISNDIKNLTNDELEYVISLLDHLESNKNKQLESTDTNWDINISQNDYDWRADYDLDSID